MTLPPAKTKRPEIGVCRECRKTGVQVLDWIDLNTRKVIGGNEGDKSSWCPTCQESDLGIDFIPGPFGLIDVFVSYNAGNRRWYVSALSHVSPEGDTDPADYDEIQEYRFRRKAYEKGREWCRTMVREGGAAKRAVLYVRNTEGHATNTHLYGVEWCPECQYGESDSCATCEARVAARSARRQHAK